MFLNIKTNYHETTQDGALRIKGTIQDRHEKPDCRSSFLDTSEESRKWFIFLKQCHRILISSPLLLSEKEWDTNPSREEKNAAVFANRISWRKITI